MVVSLVSLGLDRVLSSLCHRPVCRPARIDCLMVHMTNLDEKEGNSVGGDEL